MRLRTLRPGAVPPAPAITGCESLRKRLGLNPTFSEERFGEVESHLCVAFDLGYLDKATFERLSSAIAETARMIGALIRYLRKSGIKGGKYK